MTCGIQEKQNLIRYLENTPISGLVNGLRSGVFVLKKGNIISLEYLGSLKTEYGDLGGIISREIIKRSKFLVSEVMAILKRPDCSDEKSLDSIEFFIKKNEAEECEYIISIFHDKTDYIIKDGNKRAVAFYEKRKAINKDNITFPIYIIESG